MSFFEELNRSLIVITGARGTGKTIAAYTVAPPSKVERVYIHDAENSGNHFVSELKKKDKKFGYYLNLDDAWTHALPDEADLFDRMVKGDLPWANTQEQDSMIDYFKFVMQNIRTNLKKDEFDVYIMDTIERFEAGMYAYAEANPDKTGWRKKAYGEVWTKGVYPLYRAFLNALYQRGVKVVVLTSHLRTPWVDNKRVIGAVEPKGKSILFQLSQLHLWLVHDVRNEDGEPAALVFKERLGNISSNDDSDSWNVKRCLPPRIPTFNWVEVEKYLKNGVNMNNLNDRERLSREEESMLSTTLNDLQMQLMILQTQESLLEKQESSKSILIPNEATVLPRDTAVSLYDKGNGLSVAAIAEQLRKPLALVRRWVES